MVIIFLKVKSLVWTKILNVFSLYKRTQPTKKVNLILFGGQNGRSYTDNSKYLYEWYLGNRPKIKAVWMTSNTNDYKALKTMGFPVAYINSLKGISLLHECQVVCFTNSLRDFSYSDNCLPQDTKLIALRHGKSIKKVRYARVGHKITPLEKRHRDLEAKHINFVTSTSEFVSDIQEQCLLFGREKHIVTGYPRNDTIFYPKQDQINHWQCFLSDTKPRKVILYGPSWRHGRESTKFFPFDDFEQEYLFSLLKKHNILLLLRPHVNDLRKYETLRAFLSNLSERSKHVRFANHNLFPDVNSMLPFVDVLISDYSALYHDFLLLDRPLMFIPYDYADFEEQNGFLYDYFENLPGPAINSFEGFCEHIELLVKGEDPYAEKRRKLTDKIHTYKDDKSCERVAALIDKLLEE